MVELFWRFEFATTRALRAERVGESRGLVR